MRASKLTEELRITSPRVSTAMHTEIAELMRIAAMIFLKDNVLAERDLQAEDIKPRLLGTPK